MTKFKDIKEERYDLLCGTYSFFNEKLSDFGYTIILKRPDKHTHVQLSDYNEAVETIKNHCDNYESYVESDRRKGEYLMSPEGRWGL